VKERDGWKELGRDGRHDPHTMSHTHDDKRPTKYSHLHLECHSESISIPKISFKLVLFLTEQGDLENEIIDGYVGLKK